MKDLNYAGSQWAKWDLHIHSNASDGNGTPQQIIEKAKEKGLSVIALTDHHTVKNIDEIKKLGNENNITVISGIEFRTEYGSKSVHMIGLFPDEYNGIKLTQQALNDLILVPLNLSETIIKTKGKEEDSALTDEQAFKKGMFLVQVNFKEAAELVHKYGGLISVHAGNKANSIEEMKHEGRGASNVKDVVDSLGPVKNELLKYYIDICELGSLQDKNASFYISEFGKPAIVASDAHRIDEVGKLYTWIKADKTFEGLRQIVYEPELRARIQENMPDNKSDYQVIDAIKIVGEDFGEQVIPFNQDLNVIIGGRSSGKSILLGCIAKLANYSGLVKLENEAYNKYIDDIIENMKLKWRDDTEGLVHKVEYFPQSYINKLASTSKETIVLIEKILKEDEKRREVFETYNNCNSKNMFEITNEIENYFKLFYKLEEMQEEAKEIGDIRGVQKEIAKIESEISQVKSNSSTKISEDDEILYDELKKEKEILYQEIVSFESAQKQLEEIKNFLLVREIKTELIGLPETNCQGLFNQIHKKSTKRCQKHRMAPDTSFDRLHFSVQQVFAEIRIVWQLVDIWLPAPLDFGQFQRIGCFQRVIVARHIQNIRSNIVQTPAAEIGGRFYPDTGIHIDWIYANRQPDIAYLVRPEQFKIRALPQMFRKDFLYSLNFMFLFFCVKHFCVLLDKNFGAYHHQFSTRRLRLSVCHIC